MGSIQERKNSKGEASFVATLRVKGYPTSCKTFHRKSDAKSWIIQEKSKVQRGLYLDSCEAQKHTLSEAIEKFSRQESVSLTRVAHFKRWHNAIGGLFLSAITEVRINNATSEWQAKQGNKIGPATINRHINSLSVVFEAARQWGWITKNPARDAKKYSEPSGRVRFLSDEEREKLLQACRASIYKPLELVVILALSTGMRREELLSLKWPQVDLAKGTLILYKTKNNTNRRVYIRGRALELLKSYAKIRRINSDYIFPGEKRSPIKPCKALPANERHFNIQKAWLMALEKSDLHQIKNEFKQVTRKSFRFHDLRHSCASYLAMNGATLLEIAEVLGHKSLAVVKRYAHLSDTHTASVVERMNERFLRGSNG